MINDTGNIKNLQDFDVTITSQQQRNVIIKLKKSHRKNLRRLITIWFVITMSIYFQ